MSEIEKEKPGAAGTEAAPAKKKGKLKFLIVFVVFVLLAGAGGGGFYYWRSMSVAAAEKQDKKSSSKKSDKEADGENAESNDTKATTLPKPLQNALPDDEDVKKIIEIPPFIVNLADTEQARYLRMTVSLGVNLEGAENDKPNQLFLTRVRNAMLAILSDKRSDEILNVEGKTKLRKELLEAAKAASADPEVKAIYITDFIVQL